ncbi:colicin V synthesis protein [Pantoea agglomerans]|uniref:colicin V synthesis protein n=2 Tax=Pantoea TaxID=53335 RepID=UPI001F198905|nr:colicin V synthesis protein [Pantoea agglomerans]UIL54394.1 colicin V synthesis protein [Pantoea agglomerans]
MSATLLGVAGTWGGLMLGTRVGSNGGGILGIGSLGALVGGIVGGIAGGVGAALTGLITGWDSTAGAVQLLADFEASLLNGTFGMIPDAV